jgi:hypothetical protein
MIESLGNRKTATFSSVGFGRLFVALTFMAIKVIIISPEGEVSAHSGDVFGPACGAARTDGQVNTAEWSNAAMQTFVMQGTATPLTATLRVMNDRNNLYIGITINDDEFSPSGDFLPEGDGFRIDFDNDHGGSLFDPGDDVLNVNAGSPKFFDSYVTGSPVQSSAAADVDGGGTSDGTGSASRVGGLNHFETKHPLCSGDSHDFCLQAGDVVGFRLEYLDAEKDGTFGCSRFFPGDTMTSIADIIIGDCPKFEEFPWILFYPAFTKGK